MSRKELIEDICSMTGYAPEDFAKWTYNQLEELWYNSEYA